MVEHVEKGRGRRVKESSIAIYKSGTIRLSPDLIVAKRFSVSWDSAEECIYLTPAHKKDLGAYKVWYSNDSARSGFITPIRLFKGYGKTAKELNGEYKVVVDEDGKISADLKEKKREEEVDAQI